MISTIKKKENRRLAKGLKSPIELAKRFFEKKNLLAHIQQKEMIKTQLINPELE